MATSLFGLVRGFSRVACTNATPSDDSNNRFKPQPGRVRLLKRIISNNSYAHDDQGDNLGQESRGLDGVLYKLWPFVSDIAIFVLKRDVKLEPTNWQLNNSHKWSWSNLTKVPYCCCTWSVQSYLPGCTNVPHVTYASLGPSESTTQMAAQSVNHVCAAHGRVSPGMTLPVKIAIRMGQSGSHHGSLSPRPKRHLDRFSHFLETSPQSVAILCDGPAILPSKLTIPMVH